MRDTDTFSSTKRTRSPRTYKQVTFQGRLLIALCKGVLAACVPSDSPISSGGVFVPVARLRSARSFREPRNFCLCCDKRSNRLHYFYVSFSLLQFNLSSQVFLYRSCVYSFFSLIGCHFLQTVPAPLRLVHRILVNVCMYFIIFGCFSTQFQ